MARTTPRSFGDNVLVRNTAETQRHGFAGRRGQVYGHTTPSITRVEVIGGTREDFALNVHFEGLGEAHWFARELLEFVDHGPGTEIVIGEKRLVRDEKGDWQQQDGRSQVRPKRPWWRFW
jgi:hypothetical protein